MRKTIGLDVKPPEKECEDKKCPWHGTLSVRGKVLEGVIKSAKAQKTAVVEFRHNKFIKKYERYERRKSSIVAYSPPCMKAKDGDNVVVAECRPLSKTKNFVIVEIKADASQPVKTKAAKKEESK